MGRNCTWKYPWHIERRKDFGKLNCDIIYCIKEIFTTFNLWVCFHSVLIIFSYLVIQIPQVTVLPSAVVANGDQPPELEIRFDMDSEELKQFLAAPTTAKLPANWALRFIHNQLFRQFEFPSRFCPGAFHSTILRKAEFRSKGMKTYFFLFSFFTDMIHSHHIYKLYLYHLKQSIKPSTLKSVILLSKLGKKEAPSPFNLQNQEHAIFQVAFISSRIGILSRISLNPTFFHHMTHQVCSYRKIASILMLVCVAHTWGTN